MKIHFKPIFLLILLFISCKEELYKLPVQVLTQESKNIKATSAKIEAIVINPDNENIIEKGFYYTSNDSSDLILKNKILVKDSTFSSIIEGLEANTDYSYFAFIKLKNNDLHGKVKSLKTLNFLPPSVITNDIKNVLISTCLASGEVTYDGGKIVHDKGICMSTSPNPTIKDIKIQIGQGEGKFSIVISKLLPFTTYYLRAYATNAIGTTYGNEIQFKTQDYKLAALNTSDPESVKINEATLGGETIDEGGGIITQRGICLSKNPNPTVNDLLFLSSSTGLGKYKIVITELLENTTYYFRAFAKNEKGISYGEEKSFKTLDVLLPKVETTGVISETFSSALVEGKLIDDGGSPILEQGFVFSENDDPTIQDQKAISPNLRLSLQNLKDGTTYYVRTFARNKKGIGYGKSLKFKTIAYTYADVFTHEITTYSTNTAEINGLVISEGNTPVSERGICISTNRNPSIDDQKSSSGTGPGAFGIVFRNLSEGQVYYARAYAINKKGVSYGAERSVRMNVTPPPAVTIVPPPAGQETGGTTPPTSLPSNPSTPNTILKVGDRYQGGIIAYILQPGDRGYDAGQQHGFIAAPFDQVKGGGSTRNEGVKWGCYGITISGADGQNIFDGYQNTIDIVNGCQEANIAARICSDLDLNGYTDWYLPSVNELRIMFQNRRLIGGFDDYPDPFNSYYWSSTEDTTGFSNAFGCSFSGRDGGKCGGDAKRDPAGVRAIRRF